MKIEELEKYRDEEGFIVMDEVLDSKEFETLRETRGSQNREKFWISFDDGKIMLRTNNLSSEGVEYTNYAELIVEELAKQVDIPCAHYDLIKYKGEKGVYTKNVLERENESLILAKTLLDQTETEEDYIYSINIEDLFRSFNTFRKYDDIPKEQMNKMYTDVCKSIIFEIYTMATDSHSENIGYVYYSDGNEKSIKLSPLFDNELSLMLDYRMDRIDELLENKEALKEEVKYQFHVIGIPESEREDNISLDSINDLLGISPKKEEQTFQWEELLFYLNDDDIEFEEFIQNCSRKLNIEKAMENVEERIHAKLPDKLKEFASICFNTRKQMIEKDLFIENIENDIDEVELW